MVLAAVAAFAGAFVQSATGFGFALVLGPALFAVIDPVEAVTSLLLLGLVLNLLVLFERGRPDHVDWGAIVPLLLAALPGLAVGALALTRLSKATLQVAVGIAVILAAGWQLRRRRQHARPRLPSGAALGIGFTTGVLTTSVSVSGPPIVLWLEARGLRPAEFRASLAASFMVLNVTGGTVLLAAEGGSSLDAGVVGPLLAMIAIGYPLGALVFRRLDSDRFFTLVLGLVAATGVASVVAGLA